VVLFADSTQDPGNQCHLQSQHYQPLLVGWNELACDEEPLEPAPAFTADNVTYYSHLNSHQLINCEQIRILS
jgi:hypothetical protein